MRRNPLDTHGIISLDTACTGTQPGSLISQLQQIRRPKRRPARRDHHERIRGATDRSTPPAGSPAPRHHRRNTPDPTASSGAASRTQTTARTTDGTDASPAPGPGRLTAPDHAQSTARLNNISRARRPPAENPAVLMGCAPPSRREKWWCAARDVVILVVLTRPSSSLTLGAVFKGPFIALRARGSDSSEPRLPGRRLQAGSRLGGRGWTR